MGAIRGSRIDENAYIGSRKRQTRAHSRSHGSGRESDGEGNETAATMVEKERLKVKLFAPGRIGQLSVDNRVVMASMAHGLLDKDANLTQQAIDFYVARARGGVGLIITAATLVTKDLEYSPDIPGLWGMLDSDVYLSRYRQLADAVHEYGAKISVQLLPASGYFASPDIIKALGAVGASALPCHADASIIARELSVEEINNLTLAMAHAAALVKRAGMDAIEINGHGGYILDEFMTPIWNRRTDQYGGSLDNRVRFPMEVVAAMRQAVGDDFPITYKYALTHGFEGGRELEEGLEIARMLERAGIDAICVEAGCHLQPELSPPPTTMPPGLWIELAAMAKKVVDIPVLAVGKLGYPELAERVVSEGKADFIAIGRALLADPEWAKKAKEGRIADICPCVGDLEGCMSQLGRKKRIACAVNPSVGRESQLAIAQAAVAKSVLVVGGGPAGMEAARVAALRGHEVTLWERDKVLGGNLIPASASDLKQDYRILIDYLSAQINKVGVTVELETEATPELVEQQKPDAVILAVGSVPIVSKISGADEAGVMTAVDVLLGKGEANGSVVVLGGGLVGCETALYLAQKGLVVTVLEALEDVMPQVSIQNRTHMLMLLTEAGVRLLTGTKAEEIRSEGVVLAEHRGSAITVKADTVVLAMGLRPNRNLAERIRGKVAEVYEVGDCVEPRMVIDAMGEGFNSAHNI